ncbi:hypothetical protein Ancab_005166, partial [Ancistrocladus abbreviatus]
RADVAFLADESSVLDAMGLENSSASNPTKFRTSDERNGSVTVLAAEVVFDLNPLPPRSTCKWASLRSLPSKESA